MTGRFAGRVAVITGGAAGIGGACATRLAAEGARIAVLDVDTERGAALVATLAGGAIFVATDVRDPAELTAAFGRVASELGPLAVLVNNAAVARSSLLVDSDDEHWAQVLETNFLAAVRATRLAVPSMRSNGGGAVVNIASIHSRRGYPEWAAYASAKGAMMSFTRQQAVEQAPYGIRVNVVTPGATMTEMNRRRIDAAPDPAALEREMAASNPLNRYGTPEEVANAVAFLASDEASFITGADLVCDGGAAAFGR